MSSTTATARRSLTRSEQRELAVENLTRFLDLAERGIGEKAALLANAWNALDWLRRIGVAVPRLRLRYERMVAP